MDEPAEHDEDEKGAVEEENRKNLPVRSDETLGYKGGARGEHSGQEGAGDPGDREDLLDPES